jgi:hypothetical protein
MWRTLCTSIIGMCLATALVAVPLWGQQAQEIPAAPVPAQILSAKKVFISNAGEETNYWRHRINWYSGGPNRAYNQLYAAIKSWGHYELVSAPGDADLAFEIRFEDRAPQSTEMSQFRLLVLDPKTRITLWAFTSYVEPANRAKNRDKNYDLALAALVDDVKSIVSPQAAATLK